jgi:hypothetical protein
VGALSDVNNSLAGAKELAAYDVGNIGKRRLYHYPAEENVIDSEPQQYSQHVEALINGQRDFVAESELERQFGIDVKGRN